RPFADVGLLLRVVNFAEWIRGFRGPADTLGGVERGIHQPAIVRTAENQHRFSAPLCFSNSECLRCRRHGPARFAQPSHGYAIALDGARDDDDFSGSSVERANQLLPPALGL